MNRIREPLLAGPGRLLNLKKELSPASDDKASGRSAIKATRPELHPSDMLPTHTKLASRPDWTLTYYDDKPRHASNAAVLPNGHAFT